MSYTIYFVTTKVGGSLRVVVDHKDIEANGERIAVAHKAWCVLWQNEKDRFGNETKRTTPTARMLRKLCDKEGVKVIKDQFTAAITYERDQNN